MNLLYGLAVLMMACSETPKNSTTENTCGNVEDSQVAVVSSLGFARRDENGNTSGFDLDDYETITGDAIGCGTPDQTSPEGQTGIDSAFSGLLPALEATQAVAINGLIEDAIKAGELILMLEMTRLEDWQADDCADFSISRGDGAPMIGSDGELLSSQSFKHTGRS